MDQLTAFLSSLKTKRRSEATINHYRTVLSYILRILEAGGMETDAERIGEDEINYIIDVCKVKEQSIRIYVNAVGIYCRYYTGIDPVKRMGLLWNEVERKRAFITMDDFGRIVRLANPTERMVLVLGAFMGLRRKEIANIRIKDIIDNAILIHGKGHQNGKDVQQIMSDIVTTEIYHYNQWRKRLRGTDRSDGCLIVRSRNGNIENYCDNLTAITNMITRLGRRAGVDLSVHSLRRLYCTTLEDNGCPIEVIKTLMRHNSINTTINFYLDPAKMKQQEWVQKQNESLKDILYKKTSIRGTWVRE